MAERASVRSFTLSLRPDRGLFHPADDALGDAIGLTRESLSHVVSRDGTSVLCYRLRGDATGLGSVLGGRADVRRYDTIAGEDGFALYLQVDGGLGPFAACFLDGGLVVDPPVTFTGRGVRVSVIGTATMVRGAMERLPSATTCSVERLGHIDTDRALLGALTDRQREVIGTAFEMGYYDIPRRTTHADIAAALDRSESTIDEHLRKAESRLMEQVLA